PRIVAVTHGAAGSTLFGSTPNARTIEIAGDRAPGSIGDNVGCGDAYLAILVHGLTLGWDLAACGRAASRWAAAVAGVRGATPWSLGGGRKGPKPTAIDDLKARQQARQKGPPPPDGWDHVMAWVMDKGALPALAILTVGLGILYSGLFKGEVAGDDLTFHMAE